MKVATFYFSPAPPSLHEKIIDHISADTSIDGAWNLGDDGSIIFYGFAAIDAYIAALASPSVTQSSWWLARVKHAKEVRRDVRLAWEDVQG